MASTKANRTITVDGPLFDADVIQHFRDQIGEGIQELGDEGQGILMGFISKAGFEKSGAFLRSVDSDKLTASGKIDAASVTVTDDWKHAGPGRPTKTWFEEGKRAGVRLRKGGWGFKNTAARMKTMNFEEFFRDKIAKALG